MMKRRMLAGGMAVVLSLMVMVSPALAVENTPADSTDKEVIEEPLTSETTPPEGGDRDRGGDAGAPRRDQDTQEPETPEAPATPEEPEDTTPTSPCRRESPCARTMWPTWRGFPWGTFQPETQLPGPRRRRSCTACWPIRTAAPATVGTPMWPTAIGLPSRPGRCAPWASFDNGAFFRPNDVITRAEFVAPAPAGEPPGGGDGHLPRRARHPLGGPGHQGGRPGLDRRLPPMGPSVRRMA